MLSFFCNFLGKSFFRLNKNPLTSIYHLTPHTTTFSGKRLELATAAAHLLLVVLITVTVVILRQFGFDKLVTLFLLELLS